MKSKIISFFLCGFVIMAVHDFAGEKTILDDDVEYSATSYLHAINPGGMSYKNILNMNHAPDMIRFTNPKKKHAPVHIFRYDQGIIWMIHPEMKRYEGVKLYQEFELKNGMGISAHIDHIMRTQSALKSPEKLKNLGKEIIDEHGCTHYQKRDPNPYHENAFDITDYWISDEGILIKMQYAGPDVSGTLETKDIKLDKQPDHLFSPPPDYKKAGHRISWKEEKQKLDAAKE